MNSEIKNLSEVTISENEILGKGYISIVRKARHKITKKEYACKIVSLSDRIVFFEISSNQNSQERNPHSSRIGSSQYHSACG